MLAAFVVQAVSFPLPPRFNVGIGPGAVPRRHQSKKIISDASWLHFFYLSHNAILIWEGAGGTCHARVRPCAGQKGGRSSGAMFFPSTVKIDTGTPQSRTRAKVTRFLCMPYFRTCQDSLIELVAAFCPPNLAQSCQPSCARTASK